MIIIIPPKKWQYGPICLCGHDLDHRHLPQQRSSDKLLNAFLTCNQKPLHTQLFNFNLWPVL